MRKRKKRLFRKIGALALAVVLAFGLTACAKAPADSGSGSGSGSGAENQSAGGKEQSGGKAENGGSAMGRWIERDVTPEGMDYCRDAPVLLEDGSLVMYARTGGYEGQLMRYRSEDAGESWTGEELDWDTRAGGRVAAVSMLADGTCFMTVYVYDDEMENVENVSCWLKAADSEELSRLSFLDGRMIKTGILMDADTVFVTEESDMGRESGEIYSISTGEVLQKPELNLTSFLMGTAVDGSDPENSRVYYTNPSADWTSKTLGAFDKKGNVEEKLAQLDGASGLEGAADAQGNYYYIANGNICCIAKDGSIQEQIMDDDGFQLGLETNYCTGITYVDKQNFLCIVSDMNVGTVKLMQYKWDDTVPAQASEQITVWSLKEDATVKAAVACCKSKYPDLGITYKVGVPEDGDVSEEDAVRTLSTQLVAKDAPDVLILDGLDYQNYVSKGILADLTGVVDTGLLLQNVVAPFQTEDGKLYALPARFSVPVIVGEKGDLDGIDSLASLKEAVLAGQPRPNYDLSDDEYYSEWTEEKRYALNFKDIEDLMDFVLETSGAGLIEDNKVNTQAVTEVMDFVGSVGKYYGMDRYPQEVLSDSVSVGSSSGETDSVDLSDGILAYNSRGHARYGWGTLQTPAYFAYLTGRAAAEDAKGDLKIRPGLLEGAYLPSTMVGIVAGSQKQEAAGKFVQVLLGEEVQDYNQRDGCPVLESALDKSIQKHAKYVKERGYDGDMKAVFTGVKNPVIEDRTQRILKGYMLDHARQMIAGKETLEQAVSGIEQDISLMLREQEW